MGRFSSGLFACLSDPGSLILACCGTPLIVGKNAEAIGENPVLWALTSFSPVTNALLRNTIRKEKGKLRRREISETVQALRAALPPISCSTASAAAVQSRKRRGI